MSEYIITDEQIKEAVEFTPPYKTLSYAAKYKVSGAVEIQGVAVHGLPEIVRCIDCKRFDTDDYGCAWCNWVFAAIQPDDYCAWGERK